MYEHKASSYGRVTVGKEITSEKFGESGIEITQTGKRT